MKKTCILALPLALAACQIPLAFQDPAQNYGNPGWQQPGRFGGAANQAPPQQGQPQPAFTQGGQPVQPYTDPRTAANANPGQPALLDWSGGVVDAPQEGQIRSTDTPSNYGLQESVEGRMHIIELYQAALDERDQLLTEVEALQAALQKSQEALAAERDGGASQATLIQALEEAKRRMTEENREMASRLTTAQIRRLESEKLLLETQIAWHQEKGAAAGTVSNPQRPE